jgi:UDP-glucose 6-dehydrogenase
MMLAEKLYFRISLKNGNDVRESGLVWVIKKLQAKEEDMGHYEYPAFLDRRCRLFLVQKAASE